MTIDHIMIKVKDWPKAKAYYEQALKPLDYDLLVDGGTWGGFTQPNTFLGRIYVKQENAPTRIHFAISAPSADAVKAFHQAAISAGGKDNGAPGHRDHYDQGVIGCFVIDLDDNNIEVCNSQ